MSGISNLKSIHFKGISVGSIFSPSVVKISFILLAAITAVVSNAAMISLDFRQLLTDQTQQDLNAQAILEYLNSKDLSKDAVTEIPYCELAFGRNDGLKSEAEYKNTAFSDYGALFIGSTDISTNEDTGGISFVINPKKWVRATKIVIPTYNFPDNLNTGAPNTTPPEIMISVNGGDFQSCPYTKANPYFGSFSLEVNGAVVKEFSIKVPNVLKKITSNPTSKYFLAFTRFNILYDEPQTPETVTQWEFETLSRNVYLNEMSALPLPALSAEPAAAADIAVFTSTNPAAAEIADGIIKLKAPGQSKIIATLPDNSLFLPNENYSPAVFDLTVESSQSTAVEVVKEEIENPVFYDINGTSVSGELPQGIYIKKTGSKTEKVIVR